jgi:glycosyltransferase involved in cell wall biosynthesis
MPPDEQGYVVAFGPFSDPAGLAALMESWRWAAHAMGEGWALHVAAYPSADSAHLEQMRAALDLPGPVLPAPLAGPLAAAELLAGAGAVLRLGRLCAWGDPLLHALAAARPLAIEDAWGVDARVGPAAYLAPSGDWRALGAAVLTLLVQENIAEQISQAAQLRAAGWGSQEFSARLREVYRAVQDQRRMNRT